MRPPNAGQLFTQCLTTWRKFKARSHPCRGVRDQTISQPTVVAWMTSALDVHDRCRVLEIGTGSGYQAAILSKLARKAYRRPPEERAVERLKRRLAATRCASGRVSEWAMRRATR